MLLLECSMMFALAAFCGPLTEDNHMILAFAGLGGAAILGAGGLTAFTLWRERVALAAQGTSATIVSSM